MIPENNNSVLVKVCYSKFWRENVSVVALKNYIVKQNQFSRICLDLCLSNLSSHCLLTFLILNTLISIRTNTTISMDTKPRLTYVMTWARAALTRVLKRKFLSINIELKLITIFCGCSLGIYSQSLLCRRILLYPFGNWERPASGFCCSARIWKLHHPINRSWRTRNLVLGSILFHKRLRWVLVHF